MSTLQASNAVPLAQLTIAFGSVGGTYTSVGSFTSPVEIMNFISTFDKPVQISFDGVNDHLVIPAGSTTPSIVPLNFKSNRIAFANPNVLVKQISVAPGSGSLFVCAFSASTP